MKVIAKVIGILCFTVGANCTITYAQKKIIKATYIHNFPPGMTDEVQKAYVGLFEKGRILYDINCAKCHNSIVKGIEVMPDFTKEHLAQYELRVQNPRHEEELSEMRINAEELQQVMIFLTYYKKSGENIKGKKLD